MIDWGEDDRGVRRTLYRSWQSLAWMLGRWRKLLKPVSVFEAWFSVLAVSAVAPAIAWLMNRLVAVSGGLGLKVLRHRSRLD